MSWYKFWKKSGPMQIYAESYFFLSKEDYPTKESVKLECENWAEGMPGGHNTRYTYGFTRVRLPPRETLEKMLEHTKTDADSIARNIAFLEGEIQRLKQ